MNSDIDEFVNLAAAFHSVAKNDPDRILYSQAQVGNDDSEDSKRLWISTTYCEAQQRVNKTAHFLRSIGVAKGVKVAILSSTRPEWLEADFAIVSLGGIVVSIYQSLPAKDVAYILYDSDAEIVFVENQEQLAKLTEIASNKFDIPPTEDRAKTTVSIKLSKIVSFDETTKHPLVVMLSEILDGPEVAQPAISESVGREDLASLVYTSGTTGPPKGVMQTHGNHLANVRQVVTSGVLSEDASLMLFLPLAHSFAKLIGFLGFLTSANLNFPAIVDRSSSRLNQKSVTRDIRESDSNVVVVVPRILEKMKDGVLAKSRESGLRGLLLKVTLLASSHVYRAKESEQTAAVFWRLIHRATLDVQRKIREKLFGTQLRFVLCGGAKLSVDVGEFFELIGVEISEGYGLTETCVATNVNPIGRRKLGTVGPVLASDIELKIESDGEVCFRGPNVSVGYYGRKAATKKAWDEDGWFHTGDLGSVDDDGYLSIVGRKKELIVTSYGKNIAPHHIEDGIKCSRYVSQAMLVGDGRAYCVALIVLEKNEILRWAGKKEFILGDDFCKNRLVKNLIWDEVNKVNANLARHEKVRKLFFLEEDFTLANGLLTPTLKLKRNEVAKRYETEIEEIYAN